MDASAVSEMISTPRFPSVLAAKRARLSGTCPRMRGAVSTKTQRGSDPPQAGMPPQRTFGQLLQLGDGFDSREARAGKDEREAPLGALGIGVGELDPAQHVVAQADRVADVLER